MRFEWDEDKNTSNIKKHGISFEQASLIFDGFTVSYIDDRFDYGEIREISVGKIANAAVVVVVHTDRNGAKRIISARLARKSERKAYDEAIQQAFDT